MPSYYVPKNKKKSLREMGWRTRVQVGKNYGELGVFIKGSNQITVVQLNPIF